MTAPFGKSDRAPRQHEGAYSSVPPALLRLSAGIETESDLIIDLGQGLDGTTKGNEISEEN